MKIWIICATVAQICAFPLWSSASQWKYEAEWDYGSGSGDYAVDIWVAVKERDVSSDYYASYEISNYSGADYDEHKVI